MRLIVGLGTRVAGTVETSGSRIRFTYADERLRAPGAYPLSMSLPLQPVPLTGQVVLSFLWGLLPDNDATLESWARRFRVSARNPVALLAHVGEDCAGAVQFVTEERANAVLGEATRTRGGVEIDWLTHRNLESRIQGLAKDSAAGRTTAEEGQYSLGGAQSKTALFYDAKRRRWGVPRGRTPTTHILKPAVNEFDGFAENEHFCLSLARRVGLAAAATDWQVIAGIPTLISERYDRVQIDERWERIHQEDGCQALGVHPSRKYENQGGPGFPALIRTLDAADDPTADRARLMRAACFVFLIAATDAHAKNFSLLHALGVDRPSLRLAPLYDVASVWPYPRTIPRKKMKLAMKVGSHYRVSEILPRHFAALAIACHYPPGSLLDDLRELSKRLPDEAASLAAELKVKGMDRAVLKAIVDGIARQSAAVVRAFDSGANAG